MGRPHGGHRGMAQAQALIGCILSPVPKPTAETASSDQSPQDSPSESFLKTGQDSGSNDVHRLTEQFGSPIIGYEGTEGSVDIIIGIGYKSFKHACEQEQYRAISRTCKELLGEELDRPDRRLAVYIGSCEHSGNLAIGWEASRLSAKADGRIGIIRQLGYLAGPEPYDRIVHVPYLTDGGHPLLLAATIETSLAETGFLSIIGPKKKSGEEEIIEVSKRRALELLADPSLGQSLVCLSRLAEEKKIPQSIGSGSRRLTKEQRAREEKPRWWAWKDLRTELLNLPTGWS